MSLQYSAEPPPMVVPNAPPLPTPTLTGSAKSSERPPRYFSFVIVESGGRPDRASVSSVSSWLGLRSRGGRTAALRAAADIGGDAGGRGGVGGAPASTAAESTA